MIMKILLFFQFGETKKSEKIKRLVVPYKVDWVVSFEKDKVTYSLLILEM